MTESDRDLKSSLEKKRGGIRAKTATITASANENRNEKGTDQFVRDLLRDIGQKHPWEQDGGPKWKRDALAGGSKRRKEKARASPSSCSSLTVSS